MALICLVWKLGFLPPQVIAGIYTIVMIGSSAIFWRPGSIMEFLWDSFSSTRKKSDLGASYVATPELLYVPTRQALMYHGIWVICWAVKLALNYQLFVDNLNPTEIIIRTDFSCWTPWYGDVANPDCSKVSAQLETSDVAQFVRNRR